MATETEWLRKSGFPNARKLEEDARQACTDSSKGVLDFAFGCDVEGGLSPAFRVQRNDDPMP